MTTVIDTLVLELGLDPAKFTQGQREAIDAFQRSNEAAVVLGKSIESQSAKTGEFFSILKRQAVEVLALFLGGRGIQEFVGYMTHLDAATSRTAKTLDMSTRDLSTWQGAAAQAGGSAESITGALSGLSGEMNKFMLTGQTSMLPLLNSMGIGFYDANKHIKTAGQLLLELSDHVKGMDPARATALLSMLPGMNPDTINLLLQGREAIERYMAAARAAGGTTEESAAQAKKFQEDMAILERTASNLGRTLLTAFGPQLTLTLRQAGDAIRDLKYLGLELYDSMREWLKFLPGGRLITRMLWGSKTEAELDAPSAADAARLDDAKKALAGGLRARAATPGGGGGAGASAADQEAYIRRAAIARGIDPNVAVQVARSEGLGGRYAGDYGSSFGPFQLHYGGLSNMPGMGGRGLGDDFTKSTGLNAQDPATWQSQVDFALDQAKKGGWGPWHGFRGAPFTGIGAPAAAGAGGGRTGNISHSTTITVGKIELHSSKADPEAVAGEIPAAIKRMNFAASANYGQQG